MLKTLTLGSYCHGSSLLHRSDPRTKILLTLLLMVTAFSVENYTTLLLFVFVFGVAGTVGKPLQQSLRGLKLILYLTGVTVAVNIISIKGVPLVDYPLLRQISREALLVSARMILRLALLASTATLLTFTTTPFALANGLERLLRPLNRIGIPTADFAMTLLLAIRFIPLVAEEAQKQMTADAPVALPSNKSGLMQRLKNSEQLLINLFTAVVCRGNAMATAMEARCYRGSSGRTRMQPLAFSGADVTCVGVVLILLSLLLSVEHMT